MSETSLELIELSPLRRIPVAGGNVMHALKQSDAAFHGFGEAYFSWVEPAAVKAWKLHRQMTLNLVVPVGTVRFVFFSSATNCEPVVLRHRIETIGKNNYSRLTVPPGIWFGFQGCGNTSSLILNIADTEHDPEEVLRRNLAEIEFDWSST